jgi:hypothetical protein
VSSGNKAFLHVAANTAAGGAVISVNGGAVLGSVIINSPGGAGNVLTLYDGQGTAAPARVIAIAKVDNATIPGLDYNIVAPSGLWYTLLGGTAADLTITYQ